MKNLSILSSLLFLAKETAKAVNSNGNFIVNIINGLIDWCVVIVVPAGALALLINSIIWALMGAEYKSTAKKVYIGTGIAMAIGIGAKAIALLWETVIKGSGI